MAEEKSGDPLRESVKCTFQGEFFDQDVEVYVRKETYEALERYAAADTSKERGSILLGQYSAENGKMRVVISDYVEARYAEESASTLTFTHKTWDYVHRIREEKFPQEKIVGWQHTHPGFGVFLSAYDMFIQENFFDLPFQVAYVIDPVRHTQGFFRWKGKKVEELDGFFIYEKTEYQ